MSCTWALEVPLRLGAGGCERLRDRWMCFPLNSFFSPRDPKQQGKEKPLQAQQEPAALAGKATKVELECLGSASLQYTGWFQDQVFSKCWVAGMLFRGSNTIKLMVVIVQRHCARTSHGLGMSPQPCHVMVTVMKWHLEKHPKEHSLILKSIQKLEIY